MRISDARRLIRAVAAGGRDFSAWTEVCALLHELPDEAVREHIDEIDAELSGWPSQDPTLPDEASHTKPCVAGPAVHHDPAPRPPPRRSAIARRPVLGLHAKSYKAGLSSPRSTQMIGSGFAIANITSASAIASGTSSTAS